jgi:hypothetical protein
MQLKVEGRKLNDPIQTVGTTGRQKEGDFTFRYGLPAGSDSSPRPRRHVFQLSSFNFQLHESG